MLSNFLLLSAAITLLVSASAVLGIPTDLSKPLPLDTINTTNLSPQAPQHVQNLTFTPWPATPYQIPLYSRSGIPDLVFIVAKSFHGRRPVRVQSLEDFLEEFRDNIDSEYPDPGYGPRLARQSHIDIESYTKWSIEINEGIFGYRLTTEWCLLALFELRRQVGSHGPANVFFSVKEERSTYTYGYLIIEEIGGPSLKASLADGESKFQTS